MTRAPAFTTLPVTAGIGLRPPHYRQVLEETPAIGWLEVHSENFFCAGGEPLRLLAAVRARYPISLHGVGLSLGADDPRGDEHLAKLARLVASCEPAAVSEHLCWSAVNGRHFNDLLPLPYTEEALSLVCRRVQQAQEVLRRPLLVENVSSYVEFTASTMPEGEFVAEVARRTGCGLLVDVNNIYVSAINHGFDPLAYLDALPAASVAEIHLAGYDAWDGLLVDTHGRAVQPPVWALYAAALDRFGPRPTLIEWDTDIPPLPVLLGEAAQAARHLEAGHAVAV